MLRLFLWNKYIISLLITYFTDSEYSHIGMIVRDPDFTEKPLKGIYLWQSSYEGTPKTPGFHTSSASRGSNLSGSFFMIALPFVLLGFQKLSSPEMT